MPDARTLLPVRPPKRAHLHRSCAFTEKEATRQSGRFGPDLFFKNGGVIPALSAEGLNHLRAAPSWGWMVTRRPAA